MAIGAAAAAVPLRFLATVILLLILNAPFHAARSAQSESDGIEPQTFPSELPSIRWLVIERNAATARAARPGVDCSRFVLTQATAARFLSRARRIGEHDFKHMITWLPCFAAGRLGFSDGRSGYWSVGEDGSGTVTFDDGSEVFLYCPSCRLPKTDSWRHSTAPTFDMPGCNSRPAHMT